ncbi:hypothetical protein [Pinibacter soli]|uniref:Uncharacterized protein n=1 Tax=Pinibacter soli TaxID=3044211 RepID=A0ABT6REM3_9BACT|nr:hypothetical protein [Pinibacter soli]MDI3321024.1 hypothetical protein [Pinibacter soli]
MDNYYYVAMYTVTDNGNIIEEASFFIRSPQFMDRQRIKEYIREKEKYTTESISLSNVIEIGEEMFKELAENQDDQCFKIV